MKTLDEVIAELEDEGLFADALHYLKVLKDILDPLKVKKITHEITCPQCNSVIAILFPESNDPLTWDELKQMEGKPVWVEYGIDFNQKRWVVIHSFHNTKAFCYMNVSGNYPNTFWQKDMGENEFWQAYRKERE